MVSAFLAATATKVAVYVLLRFLFTIFDIKISFGVLPLESVLLALSIVAMFVASVVAIFQPNIKRMLAYSSVAQIGYVILGISFININGLAAGIIHLFNHALIKGGMFLAVAKKHIETQTTEEQARGISSSQRVLVRPGPRDLPSASGS